MVYRLTYDYDGKYIRNRVVFLRVVLDYDFPAVSVGTATYPRNFYEKHDWIDNLKIGVPTVKPVHLQLHHSNI